MVIHLKLTGLNQLELARVLQITAPVDDQDGFAISQKPRGEGGKQDWGVDVFLNTHHHTSPYNDNVVTAEMLVGLLNKNGLFPQRCESLLAQIKAELEAIASGWLVKRLSEAGHDDWFLSGRMRSLEGFIQLGVHQLFDPKGLVDILSEFHSGRNELSVLDDEHPFMVFLKNMLVFVRTHGKKISSSPA